MKVYTHFDAQTQISLVVAGFNLILAPGASLKVGSSLMRMQRGSMLLDGGKSGFNPFRLKLPMYLSFCLYTIQFIASL